MEQHTLWFASLMPVALILGHFLISARWTTANIKGGLLLAGSTYYLISTATSTIWIEVDRGAYTSIVG